MILDFAALRLDGVYRMNDQDDLMQRIKLAGGAFSAEQAEAIAELADRYAGDRLHATSRGSFELHRVRPEHLAPIKAALTAAGLTSRGACGGAVRGVCCATSLHPDADNALRLATTLQQYFTSNPAFEGLPKKFKIGVDAGYAGGRYLIQDAGLVAVEGGWDVWVGGGLGREPQPALPLTRALPEAQLRPLLEAVIAVYRQHAPAGKRLKHVINSLGADAFRRQLQQRLPALPLGEPPVVRHDTEPAAAPSAPVVFPFFAGELTSADLRRLATLARHHAAGQLRVTADQDLALPPTDAAARQTLRQAADASPAPQLFRICPGSHDCRMGLSPTRELARQLLAALGPATHGLSLAISGCPNSCSQPQLADFGISTSRLLRQDDGAREPRFTLYRRSGDGLGEAIATDATFDKVQSTLVELTK